MAHIQLRDGSAAEVPDGLTPEAMENFGDRAQAAYDAAHAQTGPAPSTWDTVKSWLNKTPAEAVSSADTASGGELSSLASGANYYTGGFAGPTANMIGNVAADVATMPWDAPASVTNAITHTAQKFGYGVGEPDFPLAAPMFKEAFGITPPTSAGGQVLENVAQLATGNKMAGSKILPAITRAVGQDAAQYVGSQAGGDVAKAIDPRLEEIGSVAGALTPSFIPTGRINAILARPFSRGPDAPPAPPGAPPAPAGAGQVFDATQAVGAATGNPDLMPTVGMVSSPGVQSIEKLASGTPLAGNPTAVAREEVTNALKAGRAQAAQSQAAPGTNVNVSPGGAGSEWRSAAQTQLTNALQTAENNIDATESEASSRNLTDANGNPQLVTGPTLANLGAALRNIRGFDDQGRTISTLGGAGDATVNSAISDIAGRLQDQDPVAGNNMRASLAAHQAALTNPNIPPGMIPTLQNRIDTLNQNIAANQGVSFDTLRRIKTDMQTAARGGDYVSGQVADTLRDALGDHLNSVAPALGQRYSDAVDQYKQAMDLQRSFTGAKINAVGNTDKTGVYTGQPGDTQLTNAATNLLKNPQNADPYLNTPGFRNALAATIANLGNRPNQKTGFTPGNLAQDWSTATPEAKNLFTGGDPATRSLLDNMATSGSAFDLSPGHGPGNIPGSVVLAETALEGGRKAGLVPALAASWATGHLLQQPGIIRALANRPVPYFQSLKNNLPALLAIGQMQGRNNGY
jgi:hypothetical protein